MKPPFLFTPLTPQNIGRQILSFPDRRLKLPSAASDQPERNDPKILKLGNAQKMVHLASSSYTEAQSTSAALSLELAPSWLLGPQLFIMKTDIKQTKGKASWSLCREKKTSPKIINLLRDNRQSMQKEQKAIFKRNL